MLKAGDLILVLSLTGSAAFTYSLKEGILGNYEYTKYHPMSEIYTWMEQIVKENPGVVSSEVYGTTSEGRNITYLKIAVANPNGSPKKMVWMDCGIHAREWIAPAFCQWFVKEILQTYKTDKKLKQIVQNLDFYVTPVLNVDGYVYTWLNKSTRLWRKSRSLPPQGCSCHGVDLNRNFNANWGSFGVYRNCCSNTFSGPSPASENESQAVAAFIRNKTDIIICYLTIHSYGQQILLPYAPSYNELMEAGMGAAEAMTAVHGKVYEVGTPSEILYDMPGSSQDFAWLSGIPFSYTFELRDKMRFTLPEEEIQPACEEAFAGARHIITYAHDKTFGEEQIQPVCEEAYAGARHIITYVHDKTCRDGTVTGALSISVALWVTVLTPYLISDMLE